jgi:hypothetical protein
VCDHLDLLPDPRRALVLSFSPTPTTFSRPTPPAPCFHFPLPASTASLGLTQALFWSSPAQIRSRLIPSCSLFPFSLSRRDLPILRNFNTQHTSATTEDHFLLLSTPVNSTRWKRPPCPPPLSLTCQVSVSSSRAPPGVSLSLRFPFFVVGFANLFLSIPVHFMHEPQCQPKLRHWCSLRNCACPSWCYALPRPS